MRILAIRGCNLASLDGPFAVELDRAPLRRAGLFAITGPTGAGKSTILDALCLALFDTMPRLPDGQGVVMGRDGDPDALRSTDVRAVLRRGAASGWAEVDFVGVDGVAYRARWSVRRASLKARGRLQKQEMTLTTPDGRVCCADGKTRVLEEIRARLGLSFDQFRRSVLLAQGDFATFLKAPARERSALLELLTGTEIYSRLSIAAHERCTAEQRELDLLEAQRGAVAVLDDAGRAALEAEAGAARTAVAMAEAAAEAARRVVHWHRRDAQLAAAEREAQDGVAAAQAAWADAAPRRQAAEAVRIALPLRPLIDTADRCAADAAAAVADEARAAEALTAALAAVAAADEGHAGARAAFERVCRDLAEAEPALERAAALDGQIDTLAGEHAAAAADLEEAVHRRAGREAERAACAAAAADLRTEAARLDQWLTANAALAPVADQWERWDAVLARCAEARRAAVAGEATVRRHADGVAALEAGRAARDADRDAALAARDAAAAALAAVQGETVPAFDALSRRRTALTREREALAVLAGLADAAARVSRDLAAAAQERAQQAAAAETEDAAAAAAGAGLARDQAALGEAEATLHRLHVARREDVATLRAQLTPGDPCPVCGGTDHPWAEGGGALARLADDQAERVAELRRAVNAGVRAHGGHEAAARAARARVAVLDARIGDLAGERDALGTRWTAALGGRPFAATPWGDGAAASPAASLADALAAVDAELDEVARDERRALDHRDRLDTAVKTHRERETACAAAAEAAEEARRRLDAARHDHALAAAAHRRAEQDVAEALAELATPFAGIPRWQDALTRGPEAFRSGYADRAAAFLRNREALAGRLRQAGEQEARTAAKEAEVETAAGAEERARLRADGLAARLAALRGERAGVLDGRPVAVVKRELTEARQTAEQRLERATHLRQEAATRRSAAEQERATRAETARRCAAAAAAAVAALEDRAAGCGLTAAEARRRLARDDAWLAAEEGALAALDTARREAAVRLAERQRLRAEHAAEHPDAAGAAAAGDGDAPAAEAALAAAGEALETARARAAELTARLRADADGRDRLAAMAGELERRRASHAVWAALNGVIGSHNGQKFRNFAQSLSLDVLLGHANRYLDDLARRYRLERVAGADLEIQVVDREMGDEVRGVHSLSGGEMFLVSLALALGLSSMAAGAGAGGIATLFIDEGFGSLDPDSLDVALSCLEALQASGRQVGVISHVPAMVDRIGTRVRVTPLGGGRSAVAVSSAGMAGGGTAAAGAWVEDAVPCLPPGPVPA
ncbi:AAA family ATPase [Azospirillum halopraeferens]|uniref:AAA family ATPase n=1 Tax=Azospirillum halopraeferens TaxID=34010 RepID=UPI0004067A7B|nr:AAA family ATPase [Azospirillum halopraeferens]